MNKKVQLLETHARPNSVVEERQKSHFSASTTPMSFQFETPQEASSKIDPRNFSAQVHLRNEPGAYENYNPPSSSSFSNAFEDRFDAFSGPVEREQYIPKLVNVNYIEGSNDKKWSNGNFPWTKKLEVIHLKYRQFSSLHCIGLRFLLSNAITFRPITRKFSEITPSAPTKER